MARIQVMGLSFHAFHGCHPHEQRTGGVFEVDMIVDGDFSAAQNSDLQRLSALTQMCQALE